MRVLRLWERKSNRGLLGTVVNVQTGAWVETMSGVGAGLDSFLEYLLKVCVCVAWRGVSVVRVDH